MQDSGCRASVDSLLNVGDYAPSLRSRGLLLHSVATAQSTMDYSTMAVDEGVVDSPVTRAPIPERMNSPSPVWPRLVPQSPLLNRGGLQCAKRSLYDAVDDVEFSGPFKVQFHT